MSNEFGPVIQAQHNMTSTDIGIADSQIMFGTVVSVNPLSVRLGDGCVLPSEMFYPLDAVIVKKVRMIVHRAYGAPREVQFTGTANEISNSFGMLMFNAATGAEKISLSVAMRPEENHKLTFSLATPRHDADKNKMSLTIETPTDRDNAADRQGELAVTAIGAEPVTVGGGAFKIALEVEEPQVKMILEEPQAEITLEEPEITLEAREISHSQLIEAFSAMLKAKGDVGFRVEFAEEADSAPRLGEPRQNQTTAIEGIIWQGMQTGDIVQLTSHNRKQKFQISRIINRHPDDRLGSYEQVFLWDSRYSDVYGV